MDNTDIPLEDVREFSKLFNIAIPVEHLYQYYFDVLERTGSDVNAKFERFKAYRKWVSKNTDHASIKSYKLDYALSRAVNEIKSSKAFEAINSMEMDDLQFNVFDIRGKNPDSVSLMFDIREANWSILKTFDKEHREFARDWTNFIVNQITVHPMLSYSKSFRQYIFGNTNPSRFQRLQSFIIHRIMNKLKEKFGVEFVFISHDEFQIEAKDLSSDKISNIIDYVKNLAKEEGVLIRYELFNLTNIRKKMYVKNNLDISKNMISKELFSVSKNLFYPYTKKYILEEPLEENDMLFVNEGFIGKWLDDQEDMFPKINNHNFKGRFSYT